MFHQAMQRFEECGPNFPRNFVRARALSLAKKHLWPLLNQGQPKHIVWLIDTHQSLAQMLPPDWLGGLREKATKFGWAERLLSDEDVRNLLPPWVLAVVDQQGPAGAAWLAGEIRELRSWFRC